MKDRIRQLMLDKAMSQKSFASELCIAEATLSGIFNGRTRPTNQTVNAIHECFPEVNVMWLMFGEGDMYVSQQPSLASSDSSFEEEHSNEELPDLFSAMNGKQTHQDASLPIVERTVPSSYDHHDYQASLHVPMATVQAPQIQYIEKYIDKPQRKITEIRIFFDDGTYEAFTP